MNKDSKGVKGFNFHGTINQSNCHTGDGTFCCGNINGVTRTFEKGYWIYKNERVQLGPGDMLHYCIAVTFFKMEPQVRCNFMYFAGSWFTCTYPRKLNENNLTPNTIPVLKNVTRWSVPKYPKPSKNF